LSGNGRRARSRRELNNLTLDDFKASAPTNTKHLYGGYNEKPRGRKSISHSSTSQSSDDINTQQPKGGSVSQESQDDKGGEGNSLTTGTRRQTQSAHVGSRTSTAWNEQTDPLIALFQGISFHKLYLELASFVIPSPIHTGLIKQKIFQG